jgi:hypothetical protein
MASTKRMAALAVGVGSAKPLPYLSGAVNGARDFHGWAQGMGYDSQLLVDEQKPVTIPRLAGELEALLNAAPAGTHRLVIYFAGHGVLREAEEGLWLLSDWYTQLEAVHVEAMKRRLYRFRVHQIAIFADACRGVAPDIGVTDLTAHAVLGRGPGEPATDVEIDKFIAAQDGSDTYMVPGATPSDDRCLFSGVLIEGLWGMKPEAFSKLRKDKITGGSLGAYLKTEVPELAKRYGRKLNPNVSATFLEGDDIYFGDGPKTTPPVFAGWPPPEAVAPKLEQFRMAYASETIAGEIADGGALERQLRTQDRPTHFETGSGFAIDGDAVLAIWTPRDVTAEMDPGGPGWWRVRPANSQILSTPAPVLIEFASGNFAAVTALPDFIGSLVVRDRGVAGLIYRETYTDQRVATPTERAIGELEKGLRADAATDLAVELRQEKHADPVRGVISAYLYDSIGDLDSIRRMAYYYVQHDQPIPYDIALLGQLGAERRDDGVLVAQVPAVLAREPRTEAEQEVEWSYTETPEATGEVGGFWPWLRQGWAFLEEPGPGETTVVIRHLTRAARNLQPARFTTLDQPGGRQISQLLQLEPRH